MLPLAWCTPVLALQSVDARELTLSSRLQPVTTARLQRRLTFNVEMDMARTTPCASSRGWELPATTRFAAMDWLRNNRKRSLTSTMSWGEGWPRPGRVGSRRRSATSCWYGRTCVGWWVGCHRSKDGLISAYLAMMTIEEVLPMSRSDKTLPWQLRPWTQRLLIWASLFKCGMMKSRTLPVQLLAVTLRGSPHTGVIGHYAQVVWAKTKKVGCGFIQFENNGMFQRVRNLSSFPNATITTNVYRMLIAIMPLLACWSEPPFIRLALLDPNAPMVTMMAFAFKAWSLTSSCTRQIIPQNES